MIVCFAVLGATAAFAPSPKAQQIGADLASRLTGPQQRAYVNYLRARARYNRESTAYWSTVDELKDLRRRKRAAGQPFTPADYVAVQPPKYSGPPMPADVARIIAARRPSEPPETMPVVADFLANARKHFGFIPSPTSEAVFKRRYAEESLEYGLTKDQVIRVYALETGGRGTFDMQAGFDPETKKGRPISSALGYAQLLGANSVNELVKNGETIIDRLDRLAAAHGNSAARSRELKAKSRAVRRMFKAARSVPNVWSSHVAFSRTPKGLGIHALNLDSDIGPWLQTIKLKGVRDYAEKAGRFNLSGAEIELMNLAGPQTGLDMMEPVGRNVPTSNFFAEAAYNRNPIVKDKTSAELLAALESRMDQNMKKNGSVEFAKIFDMVRAARARAARR
jgi:hypothetical protein